MRRNLDNPELAANVRESGLAVEWKHIGMRAGIAAGIAGVATMLLLPERTVNVLGVALPQSVGIAIGCGVGSAVGDAAHAYLVPLIPQDQKYANAESAAVSLGGAMVGCYAALSLMGDVGLLTPVILGGGSYAGADYLHKMWYQENEKGFLM